MLITFAQSSQALWDYERATHEGPVLGEGTNHWFYSGLLDGVEAQLGAGSVRPNLGEAVPLFVDFDLLRIHPLQVNHGMGYYSRWTKDKTGLQTTAQADAYRMQEIAFGHAPFLGTGTWKSVPRALVESKLVTPVAASYGTSLVSSIQYHVDGSWTSSSTAAQSSQFAQVKIIYNNGLTVVANASATPLLWSGLTIPQYGWAAKGRDLLAYTAQCGKTICDYAETQTSVFANARNQADAEIGLGYAGPSIVSVKQSGVNTFAIEYSWRIDRTPDAQAGYRAFVHFVNEGQVSDAEAGTVFQSDYQLTPKPSQWKPGQTVSSGSIVTMVPTALPDGTYSVRTGLFDPATGNRLPLSGNIDGTGRCIVGFLKVSRGASKITFEAQSSPLSDPRLDGSGSAVDFGLVRTDGMIAVSREGNQWVLRPYPRSRNFTILLRTDKFAMPTTVYGAGTTASIVTPLAKGAYWQLPLNGSSSYIWSAK
jgi:hypothetical protein